MYLFYIALAVESVAPNPSEPSDQASVKARTVPAVVRPIDGCVGEGAWRQGAAKSGFNASDAKKVAGALVVFHRFVLELPRALLNFMKRSLP